MPPHVSLSENHSMNPMISLFCSCPNTHANPMHPFVKITAWIPWYLCSAAVQKPMLTPYTHSATHSQSPVCITTMLPVGSVCIWLMCFFPGYSSFPIHPLGCFELKAFSSISKVRHSLSLCHFFLLPPLTSSPGRREVAGCWRKGWWRFEPGCLSSASPPCSWTGCGCHSQPAKTTVPAAINLPIYTHTSKLQVLTSLTLILMGTKVKQHFVFFLTNQLISQPKQKKEKNQTDICLSMKWSKKLKKSWTSCNLTW